MNTPEQAATRAALLELKEEHAVVAEAYEFIDEKRLLLAAELLRQLELYEHLLAELDTLAGTARIALAAAVRRHGLQGLSVYPAARLEDVKLEVLQRNFMGVSLLEIEQHLPAPQPDSEVMASDPSHEEKACRRAFHDILEHTAALAELSGNLYRLLIEYRLTERRARALENVILPEIEQDLVAMNAQLEEADLEDAIRARLDINRQFREAQNPA